MINLGFKLYVSHGRPLHAPLVDMSIIGKTINFSPLAKLAFLKISTTKSFLQVLLKTRHLKIYFKYLSVILTNQRVSRNPKI